MPRKIKPKYGIDPTQKVNPFSFTNPEIGRLIDALAPMKGNRKEIIAQLERHARDYVWLRDQYQQKPTRAEQNAALKELGNLAAELAARLRGLDMDTQWEVMISLREFYTKNPTDPITALADRLENFENAAEQVLRAGKKKSGPRIRTHVQRTVVKLANLYEEVTGEHFFHNPKHLTKYDGKPHSRAGGFIVAFFKIVDSRIIPQSLSTAMASFVKSRHSARKLATS